MTDRVWIVESVEYGGTVEKVFDDEGAAALFANVLRGRGEPGIELNEYLIESAYEPGQPYWEVTYRPPAAMTAEGRGEVPRYVLLDTVTVEDDGYSIWVQARGEHDAMAKAAEKLALAGVAVEAFA